jgi:predicted GTPase
MYLESKRPVVAVCAVRTGAGKSPTSQFLVDFLTNRGLRVAVVRHPMPYGDLEAMEVQRFASYEDFLKYDTTIEEREEYEPYVRRGVVIWAGVDYRKILRRAEKEADVLIWDGGNNDLPFYRPDLHITVVDPHRPGHGLAWHPGEANLRAADVVLVGKSETASPEAIREVSRNSRSVNPAARIFRTRLEITALDPHPIRGRRVIVVEDGPTLTHGGMAWGAGALFARREGAKMVNPAPYAVGSIGRVYRDYPHIGHVLPAMGYGARQIREFEETIRRARADVVIGATPVDLARLIRIDKPLVQVRYALAPTPAFRKLLGKFADAALRRRR